MGHGGSALARNGGNEQLVPQGLDEGLCRVRDYPKYLVCQPGANDGTAVTVQPAPTADLRGGYPLIGDQVSSATKCERLKSDVGQTRARHIPTRAGAPRFCPII